MQPSGRFSASSASQQMSLPHHVTHPHSGNEHVTQHVNQLQVSVLASSLITEVQQSLVDSWLGDFLGRSLSDEKLALCD